MISILIPSKNEPRVQEVIRETESSLRNWNAQVIVMNDREGRGKGWAMRKALEQAHYDLICFLDGDMDIAPHMLIRLLPFLREYDIVCGRKQIRGILSRRIISRLARLFNWIVFGINVDTQTGIKAFHRKAIPEWTTDGYMFDLEIIAKAAKRGARIIEVPVEALIERKMNARSVWKCLVEAIRIRRMI